jgi:hypothetical protein
VERISVNLCVHMSFKTQFTWSQNTF